MQLINAKPEPKSSPNLNFSNEKEYTVYFYPCGKTLEQDTPTKHKLNELQFTQDMPKNTGNTNTMTS